jgi:predicted transposase
MNNQKRLIHSLFHTPAQKETSCVVPCKLITIPQQRQHLEITLQAFADACNYVWIFGREKGVSQQWQLHQACYQVIRELYGLPANLAIRAVARVAPALKDDRKMFYPFLPYQIVFDTRTFSFKESEWAVGLTLLNGREKFHLDIGACHIKVLQGKNPSSAILFKKYKSYYLDIQV